MMELPTKVQNTGLVVGEWGKLTVKEKNWDILSVE